jgi:hypothetical protein
MHAPRYLAGFSSITYHMNPELQSPPPISSVIPHLYLHPSLPLPLTPCSLLYSLFFISSPCRLLDVTLRFFILCVSSPALCHRHIYEPPPHRPGCFTGTRRDSWQRRWATWPCHVDFPPASAPRPRPWTPTTPPRPSSSTPLWPAPGPCPRGPTWARACAISSPRRATPTATATRTAPKRIGGRWRGGASLVPSLSLCWSVCLSVRPSIWLAACLPTCVSVCCCVCLSVGLFVRLSVPTDVS